MINWAYIFLDNTILQWVEGLSAGFAVLLILGFLKWLLRWRNRQLAQRSNQNLSTLMIALLDHTLWIFIVWLAVFTFLRFLNLIPTVLSLIDTITIVVVLIQIGLWSGEVIEFWLTRRQKVISGAEPGTRRGSVAAVVVLAKIVVWTMVIILVLENIPGIHVTTLIASLGIGGIAIGLALQKILGDLFASLTISIDQPFVEGDAINVDQFSGQVEHIGLKSTRVRSDTGEELIFSNTDLLDSRIRNFKRMDHRMVIFTLKISFDTPYEKLQKISTILQNIISSQPKVAFNRAHFKSFDATGLIYEIVYTVNTADFNLYMDIHQAINLQILSQFHDEGIGFA
jgi:small-conductance mechanosensitive channel